MCLLKEIAMRILYDSKLPQYKTPFGTLTPGQVCALHIHIPCTVQATSVMLLLKYEDGKTDAQNICLVRWMSWALVLPSSYLRSSVTVLA